MIAVSHNHVYKLFQIQVKKRIRLEAGIWFVRVTPDEDNRKENKMKRVQQFAEKPLCMPGRRFFVQAMKHCVPSVLHTTLLFLFCCLVRILIYFLSHFSSSLTAARCALQRGQVLQFVQGCGQIRRSCSAGCVNWGEALDTSHSDCEFPESSSSSSRI